MDETPESVRLKHDSEILSSIRKLLEEDFIPDFTIKAREKTFKVHRVILAVCSAYFRRMFSHPTAENSQGFVNMEDTSSEALKQCVDFIYTGEANVGMDNVHEVTYAAEKLCLSGLANLCIARLRLHLDVHNCLEIKIFAWQYSWNELETLADNLAVANFETVIKSDDFPNIEISDLKVYLKSSKANHDISWQAVVKWIDVSAKREEHLLDLLEAVNIDDFPVDFLLTHVLEEPFMQKYPMAIFKITSLVLSNPDNIQAGISLHNWFILYNLTNREETCGVKKAKDVIIHFMMENFENVAQERDFKFLGLEDVKAVLRSSETKCTLETTKFTAVEQWVKHETERENHFPELFKFVSISQLPLQFVQRDLQFNPLVKKFSECRGIVESHLLATPTVNDCPIEIVVLNKDTGDTSSVKIDGSESKVRSLPKPPGRSMVSIESDWMLGLILITSDKVFKLRDGRWMEQITLKQKIHKHAKLFSHRESIFIVAQKKTSTYSIMEKQYSDNANGCDLGFGFCSDIAGDYIYAMGGSGTNKVARRLKTIIPEGRFFITPNYLLSKSGWENVTEMQEGRVHASAAALGNRVYVVGGISAARILNSVEFYDPETKQWTMVNSMLTCRARLQAYSDGKKLCVIGGDHTEFHERCFTDTIEVYDKEHNIWKRTGASLPRANKTSVCRDFWGDERRIEEKKKQLLTVAPGGKISKICGCTITFPPHSFKQNTDVFVSVETDPADLGESWEQVTSILCCQAETNFVIPVSVGLLTSYSQTEEEKQPEVMVFYRQKNGAWKEWSSAIVESNLVMFEISQSCCVVAAIRVSNVVEEDASAMFLRDIKQETEEKRKEKAEVTQTIKGEGGTIELHGCRLTFPPGALNEEKEITLSVDNNQENYPKILKSIAPTLGFKPSLKFDKPVTVEMRTWFSAKEGKTIPAVLSSRKRDSEWKKVGDIEIGSKDTIKFTVTHFCQINLGVLPQDLEQGEYTIRSDVYIQRDTRQILSCFYLDAKAERDISDTMRRKSCAAFYPGTLQVRGRREQLVTTKLKIYIPEQHEITPHDMNEFQIGSVVDSQDLFLQYIPHLCLTDYVGLIEGEYFIHVNREEKRRAYLSRMWPITLDPPDLRPTVNVSQSSVEYLHVQD